MEVRVNSTQLKLNRSKVIPTNTKVEVIFVGRKKQPEFSNDLPQMPVFESEEALENAMISQATRLAWQQLCDGTASSQVITHYLKLGSTKERIEQDILRKQAKLIDAKTESIKDQKKSEKLYQDALNAFRTYSGQRQEVDPDEELL